MQTDFVTNHVRIFHLQTMSSHFISSLILSCVVFIFRLIANILPLLLASSPLVNLSPFLHLSHRSYSRCHCTLRLHTVRRSGETTGTVTVGPLSICIIGCTTPRYTEVLYTTHHTTHITLRHTTPRVLTTAHRHHIILHHAHHMHHTPHTTHHTDRSAYPYGSKVSASVCGDQTALTDFSLTSLSELSHGRTYRGGDKGAGRGVGSEVSWSTSFGGSNWILLAAILMTQDS